MEIKSPCTTYFIKPYFEKGKKRYFRITAKNIGYAPDFVSTFARCQAKVEELVERDKKDRAILDQFSIKGVLNRVQDVSNDYFEVVSDLEKDN